MRLAYGSESMLRTCLESPILPIARTSGPFSSMDASGIRMRYADLRQLPNPTRVIGARSCGVTGPEMPKKLHSFERWDFVFLLFGNVTCAMGNACVPH